MKMPESVVVTVGIDKNGTKSYDISMGAIKVNNLANGLSLSYESADVLEIQIRGREIYWINIRSVIM